MNRVHAAASAGLGRAGEDWSEGDQPRAHAVNRQAFHWFDARAAAAMIHRVVRPHGRLAVIWNTWDTSVPWIADVQDIVHAHLRGAPQQRTSPWSQEVDGTGVFTALTENTFPNHVTGGRGEGR